MARPGYADAMIITVVGEHCATGAPERALVSLQLVFDAEDPAAAMQGLAAAGAVLNDELGELTDGDDSPVTWSAVQDPGTRSWRPWDGDGRQQPMRHEASMRARVQFRDFAVLGAQVARWGERDGWQVQSVAFELTDATRGELEAAVLAGAVEDARRRAGIVAAAAGAGEVRVLEVADPGLLGGGAGAEEAAPNRAMMARAYAGEADEGLTVAPEDVEVTARVHARFEA